MTEREKQVEQAKDRLTLEGNPSLEELAEWATEQITSIGVTIETLFPQSTKIVLSLSDLVVKTKYEATGRMDVFDRCRLFVGVVAAKLQAKEE